jgi:hypothetical protein
MRRAYAHGSRIKNVCSDFKETYSFGRNLSLLVFFFFFLLILLLQSETDGIQTTHGRDIPQFQLLGLLMWRKSIIISENC